MNTAFDFGYGHHNHVIIVTIGDQLVPATLNDFLSSLEKFEGGRGVALHKHVTASRLFCKVAVLGHELVLGKL